MLGSLLGGQQGRPVPDNGDELGHGELVWNQNLGYIQRRLIFLFVIALSDDRDLVWELGLNPTHLLFPVSDALPLFEGLLCSGVLSNGAMLALGPKSQ